MVTFVLASDRLSDCTGRLFNDRNGIKNAALIVMFTEWRGPLPSVGVASDRPIHSFAAESNHWNELSCGDHASASTRCLIALLSRPTPSVCLSVWSSVFLAPRKPISIRFVVHWTWLESRCSVRHVTRRQRAWRTWRAVAESFRRYDGVAVCSSGRRDAIAYLRLNVIRSVPKLSADEI